LFGRRTAALAPIGGKKEVAFADFKKIMEGLTDTTPTKDIVNAFKVFDKDVRLLRPRWTPCCPRTCVSALKPNCWMGAISPNPGVESTAAYMCLIR
jgi:hypothetical protein